jgi:dTDP-4-amino-4,6-dideoxygalactose transaminase
MRGALSPRTAAVMPVHLFGQIAPMGELLSLARAAAIAVVEDMAQAQGARQDGRAAATFGAVAGTSFYPGKNIGAYGDAGAVLTNDGRLAERLQRLRNHGGTAKYEHLDLGFNSRLDTLQAVVLTAKLRHLDEWNQQRAAAAAYYGTLLADVAGVELPVVAPGNDHVWHLYVILVDRRDAVLAQLHEAGIGAGIHYPTPLHLLPAFANLGYRRGDLPVAEDLSARILSLPLYPGISQDDQEFVVDELRKAIE